MDLVASRGCLELERVLETVWNGIVCLSDIEEHLVSRMIEGDCSLVVTVETHNLT